MTAYAAKHVITSDPRYAPLEQHCQRGLVAGWITATRTGASCARYPSLVRVSPDAPPALGDGEDDLYFGSGCRQAAFVAENQIPVARPDRRLSAFQIEIKTAQGQVNGGRQAESA